jgi:hypothetical protein
MIEYLPLVLTGVGIIVSILYYTSVLRNANKTRELQLQAQEQALETRQAQMFLQMLNRWRDEVADLDVWPIIRYKIHNAEEYLERQQNDEDFRKVIAAFIGFYEGLGVVVKEGYLSVRMVALMWAGMTRTFWENILEDTVSDLRIHYGLPRMFSETEYVCREVLKYMEEHPELAT